MNEINHVVKTCRFVGKRTNTSTNIEQDLFLCTTVSGLTFWSNEQLVGKAITLQERKAGDKYQRRIPDDKGGFTIEDREVLYDGWNYVGSMGNAVDVRAMKDLVLAVKELETA